jgi:hypothetical protein
MKPPVDIITNVNVVSLIAKGKRENEKNISTVQKKA